MMKLIRKLKDNRDSGIYPFHMPGHKRRLAGDELLEKIYGIDITEIDGFDDLHDPTGILKEAEDRAAECFGADETHFLVNGSTGGILAAICATVGENDNVIMGRNCHRSVYNAIMLSGAKPCIITPEREALFDVYGGIDPKDVSDAVSLVQKENGQKRRTAVVITSPTYEGITSDIRRIADICHDRGVVLIVDAAHGAHFGFSDRFPESAVTAGADIVVTSVHKTLPAMTQTALIHINKCCPTKERIRKMLQIFMTSSPSYVLMASIDAMTDLLEDWGRELFSGYVARLEGFYHKAEQFNAISLLTKEKLTAPGSADHDMGRIVVSDMTGTLSGPELSDVLLKEYDICAEMAQDSYVTLITGIADTGGGFERLEDALTNIDEMIIRGQPLYNSRTFFGRLYDRVIGKRVAGRYAGCSNDGQVTKQGAHIRSYENKMKAALFEEDCDFIPIELAEGRIARDFVTVYPPGIPVLVPGQMITGDDVDVLLKAKEQTLKITGLNNGEVAVIWEKSST